MEWFTRLQQLLELLRTLTGMPWFNTLIEKLAGSTPQPQTVRWGPVDGRPAGITVSQEARKPFFIPWENLETELTQRLLPQAFANPSGFCLKLDDHHGKRDWLMVVADPEDRPYCSVWLGPDPLTGWQFDGLIRFGDHREPHVWQTYQRMSDGTYRRLQSAFGTLERARSTGQSSDEAWGTETPLVS